MTRPARAVAPNGATLASPADGRCTTPGPTRLGRLAAAFTGGRGRGPARGGPVDRPATSPAPDGDPFDTPEATEVPDALRRLQASESALRRSREQTILRLAKAVQVRTEETGAHIERVGALSALMAARLGLGREFQENLALGALLHDLGKIGIPDEILNKPGRLTREERAVMQRHTTLGWELLAGSGEPLLDLAARIALTHHERYDGGGYPNGLRGEAIPLEGRIVAVADVFDSLTNDRAYREALAIEDATAVVAEGRGTLFDPQVVDGLLADHNDIHSGQREAATAFSPDP